MNKYQIANIETDVLNDFKAPSAWMEFLKQSSWHYKHSFYNQLLITYQREDATAVTTMKAWNEKLNRYVNTGAKRILIIENTGNRREFVNVFDIKDTHINQPEGYQFKLWHHDRNEGNDAYLFHRMMDRLPAVPETNKLADYLFAVIDDTINNSQSEISDELHYPENLEYKGLDQDSILKLIGNSAAYQVFERCGIDGKRYFDESDFEAIKTIENFKSLSLIGKQVNQITKPLLIEIGKTILEVEKEKGEQNNEQSIQIKQPNLQTGRGLPESRNRSADTSESADREVRNDERSVSGGTSPGSIDTTDLLGSDQRASSGSGSDSQTSTGTDHGRDGEKGSGSESERTANRMGGLHEDDRETGGRNSPEGDRVQQVEQIDLFSYANQFQNENKTESAENAPSVFSFSVPESIINRVLQSGTNDRNSDLEIAYHFSLGQPAELNALFLKEYFKEGGKGLEIDGEQYAVYWNHDGYYISQGDTIRSNYLSTFMTWDEVTNKTQELLNSGNYLSNERSLMVMDHEIEILSEQCVYIYRDNNQNLRSYLPALENLITINSFPASKDDILKQFIKSYQNREPFIDRIAEQMNSLANAIQLNPKLLRNKYFFTIESVSRRLENLNTEHLSFQSQIDELMPVHRFITKDEIDQILLDRSLLVEGRHRIYDFFMENHSQDEKVAFLKNAYGTGGRGATDQVDIWHDASGFKLSWDYDDEVTVSLKWPQVSKRVDELIETGQYNMEGYFTNTEFKDVLTNQVPYPDLKQAIATTIYSRSFDLTTKEEIVKQLYLKAGSFYEPDYGKYNQEYTDAGINFINKETNKNHFKSWFAIVSSIDNMLNSAKNQYFTENFNEVPKTIEPTVIKNSQDEDVIPDENDTNTEDLKSEFDQLEQADESDSEPLKIGSQFYIDDRLFEVDSISETKRTINLKDITFAQTSGFPIFREESYSVIEGMLREGILQYYEPEPVSNDVIEENVQRNAGNYRLLGADTQLYSDREKFKYNIAAIETLQQIGIEKRVATPAEQEILSHYVGWGGLAQAFDAKNVHWKPEYEKLKSLLSDQEYANARESTLNAHYTSPTVIKAMYGALSNMGFETGNILEPSMGVGHFFGLIPNTMKDSKLYGVEIDTLTYRIAKQLYPEASIFEGGFEKTDYSNNFFDVVVGNVPFGDYKVYDKEYQKENFLIHDYFFAKSLDKLRPGGVMAMITSKGTMDKKSPAFREYMAKRAELLGAVRLPNNTFNHAGTEVTSDILIFKKRERMTLGTEDWVHLNTDKNNIPMNSYFVDHPEMILGEMGIVSGRFGEETACLPVEGKELGVELRNALENITYHFPEDSIENTLDDEQQQNTLPADPNVDNFSFTVIKNQIYFRNNSVMTPVELPEKTQERVKGMIELRDCVRDLIQAQLDDEPDSVIEIKQNLLGTLYDQFIKKNNHINTRGNKLAFQDDGSYWLLCALEKFDDDGNYIGKSDIFTQRTIAAVQVAESVDTANEALIVSIGEKARVDLNYMEKLCSKSQDEIIDNLVGVIYHDPQLNRWVTADEYLSGNVRDKLERAKEYAKHDDRYLINVQGLEKAQPKELEASEIEVNLGATWINTEYLDQFILDTFKPANHLVSDGAIKVNYSEYNGTWNITGKSMDSHSNVLINATYGTKRANAYRILENALNLKDMRIMDSISTPDGERLVVNQEETILANQKQELIKEAFKDWIFKDQERRNTLVEKYNVLFNSTRPREYDGQHIVLHGVSPFIQLRDHQKNAVARALYGGNTLLGHCVGAGKTFEMATIAMESKYLGLCSKSMFVVPNHLVGDFAAEFLGLYPGANILVAEKKDFEPANRKKFCSRIATGNYDAVVIGHSQFERIPLSKEFQADMINRQIENVMVAIDDAVSSDAEHYTVKQLEKTRKSLEARLEKLNDTDKDSTVSFEELGIDRLFVDEAHNYKNLFLYTKMRNVAGIGQSEAQKSTDMFNKCQYMDELTGSKGIIFATGTPISNSISELYTMMRYLQYDRLQASGLGHFDSWASNFTQQVTAVELSPEGNTYRSKTRLARFYNLPELMAFFKEIADIQTADMLNLPVPDVTYVDEKIKPSEFQHDMLQKLVDRAKAVRDRRVEPYEDNMLKITNDGRKLALDQRLINPLLPDSEDSKANRCVENAYNIWQKTHEEKSAQLLFCDLSTPHYDGQFNVYDDIKNKLIQKGVPEKEIAFIHDARTDAQKVALFGKVRSGQVRFLLGSTPKMGAGTNVQDRLIALHHLDVPWKPSDIEQQEGRILRQGNMNPEVKIFRYITEQTFDAYSWQLIENKQKFIGQIMTSKSPSRSCEDVDEQALSYAEVKALATGNPLIKEKMDLDIKVAKLKLLKSNHTSEQYRMEDNIAKVYPLMISNSKELKSALQEDLKIVQDRFDPDNFKMMVGDKYYSDKKDAGKAIIEAMNKIKTGKIIYIGQYSGFKMFLEIKGFDGINLILKNQAKHSLELGKDPIGNITRINNVLQNIPGRIEHCDQEISDTKDRLKNAQIEVLKPFAQEQELTESISRLKELDLLLSEDPKQEFDHNMEGSEEIEWEEVEV